MAEKIVSPGVFTRENDLSFLAQGVAAIGTAFVGPFKEGPIVPVLVNTQVEFEQMFGTVDDTYYTGIAVQKYLKEAGAATVCRVAGVGGYTEKTPTMFVISSGSFTSSLSVVFSTRLDSSSAASGTGYVGVGTTSSAVGTFLLTGNNSLSISASLVPTSVNNIQAVLGSDARGSKSVYSYAYFSNKAAAANFTSASLTTIQLPNQTFTEDAREAQTPYIESQLISGQRYKMLRFETIGAGNAANTKVKVGISNIKKPGTVAGTTYGTFTVTVRAFSDTNRRRNALETYSNVNMDPTSPNYVYRVIGDRHLTFDSAGRATESGDWVNKSKYIRLVNTERDTNLDPTKIPVEAMPFGHAPYYSPISASATTASLMPAATYTTPTATQYGGLDLEDNTDNLFLCNAIPAAAVSGTLVYSTGSNAGFYLDGTPAFELTGSNSADIAKRNILIAFQQGFDGQSPTIPIKKGKDMMEDGSNTQGFDCSSLTASGSVAYQRQFDALSSDQYDIQMLVTPGLVYQYHPEIVDKAIDLVTDRADCFYVMDGTAYDATIADAKNQAAAIDSNYVGMYYPWIKTVDVNTNKLIAIPPSVLMPATYAANDRVAAEWFAPAGLNRGGLSGAVSVLSRLTQGDRDDLYENKVNPIVQFPGQGIVAFGQKTLQNKPSALDRINVRRLLLTVRKYIASTSRYLVFEQNTSTTRNRFLNIVNPYLEGIQQRQGLYAFKVVMDESNNTPDSIDRNFLNGSIYLQPTKTAEFIQIDFNILPTGAKFGG